MRVTTRSTQKSNGSLKSKSDKRSSTDARPPENCAKLAPEPSEAKPADIEAPEENAPPEAFQAPQRPIDVALGTRTVPVSSRPPAPAPPKPLAPVDITKHSEVLTAVLERSPEESSALLAKYHRHHVLPRLERYLSTPAPTRPSALQLGDAELVDRVKGAKASMGARKEDREFLESFGDWRGSVFEAEVRDESNLVLLLSAIKRFEDAEDLEGAFEVRRFVSNEYRFRIPDAGGLNAAAIRDLAFKWSRRYDLCSEALRSEKPTPKGHPARMGPQDDPINFSEVDFDEPLDGGKTW